MVRTSLLYCKKECPLAQSTLLRYNVHGPEGDWHQRAQVVRRYEKEIYKMFSSHARSRRLDKVVLFDTSTKKPHSILAGEYLAILHYRKKKSGKVTVYL